MADALDRIARWRADPGAVQGCPVCGTPGVEIIDRSARPYSEWYVLKCAACGLDASLHIPLPGPATY
ncbi:hypothetical protein [Hyphomicrobium sp.]|uniref:hypothetical protein n=1 Tax=Hyphomicrobium sp. TaxID=82 RepID=UPI0025B9FF07|nr:hypothetical protein [Hyphomicrobium sp.]